jgi:hypothetical protein
LMKWSLFGFCVQKYPGRRHNIYSFPAQLYLQILPRMYSRADWEETFVFSCSRNIQHGVICPLCATPTSISPKQDSPAIRQPFTSLSSMLGW